MIHLIHLTICTIEANWEYAQRYTGLFHYISIPKNWRPYAVWKEEGLMIHGTSLKHSIFTGYHWLKQLIKNKAAG